MKNTILYIMCMLLLVGAVTMQSCSSDSEDIGSFESYMQKRDLTFNVKIEQFGDAVTRAGGSFGYGSTLYIDFGSAKGTAVYNGSKWTIAIPNSLSETTSGTCNVYYLENPSSSTSSSISLASASIVYGATGTYKNTADEFSVTATLSPLVSRVHLRGKSGTSIKVKGLKCYKQFNVSTYALSTSTDDVSLSVKSDGYTDYLYCLFASSNNQLSVVNDGITYTRSFGSSVLRAGHSGYINIPTEDNYSGWESDKKADDIGVNGTDYDSSDSDWNQADPDKPDDITIGGEDYNGDEDWNQADSGNSGSNMHNGHEYVDLGLSVKWATCNVGASKPEEYGGYYAWGEVEQKDVYTMDTYFEPDFAKYSTFMKTILDLEDDVAHVKLGGDWRIPTKAEQDELRENCKWSWITVNDVYGYNVVGPNGNSIFLPAAGIYFQSYIESIGSYGYYWSSSLDSDYSSSAYRLEFNSKIWNSEWFINESRYNGLSVRPVCP